MRCIAIIILLMLVTVTLYATVTTAIYTTNVTEACTLANLANSSGGSARSCAMVNNNNATNDIEDQVYIKFKTGASPSATGNVIVYGYACLNASPSNCIDAGEVLGTDVGITLPTNTNLPTMVGPPNCFANVGATNYICGPYSVAQTWGGSVPTGWGIVIQNTSGAAFDATCTGCGVFYDRVKLQNQ